VKLQSLRARLFAAIALVALLSLALALALGAILTRRAVERNTLRDVSAQFDLLVEREREALVPFSRLRSLQEFLDRQDERVVQVRLDGSSSLLPPERAALLRRGVRLDGTLSEEGTRYLYAARLVNGKGFILLRPASSTTSAWRPHIEGLVAAAVVTAALAALIAFLLARAIARPVHRVAEATRGLASSTTTPPLLPVEGPRELALLAESFNEVAVALARAREAEQAFLLSVSHELKTPLTAIRGYAEGLADGAFGADEAARTIGVEAGRLERLVRDLLDLARMNRSAFAVRSEPVDLAEVAREAVRRHHASGSEFGVELAAAGEETWVTADADRLLQVASNLVENALRETPAGGRVTVTAGPGTLSVTDTGPGIPAEDIPHAFERFYLYDKVGKDRPVGSGLGLAIVAQLARAMNGTVSVESAAGIGTTFLVELSGMPPSGTQLRGVDDLEVGAAQRAERV
jgi:signal transduction histidine kinase